MAALYLSGPWGHLRIRRHSPNNLVNKALWALLPELLGGLSPPSGGGAASGVPPPHKAGGEATLSQHFVLLSLRRLALRRRRKSAGPGEGARLPCGGPLRAADGTFGAATFLRNVGRRPRRGRPHGATNRWRYVLSCPFIMGGKNYRHRWRTCLWRLIMPP